MPVASTPAKMMMSFRSASRLPGERSRYGSVTSSAVRSPGMTAVPTMAHFPLKMATS